MSTTDTSNMTGKRIAAYRKARCKSQHQFSLLINVSRSYLGDIEAGRCEPSHNFLEALLTGTDVSIDWVLTGKGLPIREEFIYTDQNRAWCDLLLKRIGTSPSESIGKSSGCPESELRGGNKPPVPIIGTQIEADFLAELAHLKREQQAQVLEFIREKRRLNELEAKVSALAARRG